MKVSSSWNELVDRQCILGHGYVTETGGAKSTGHHRTCHSTDAVDKLHGRSSQEWQITNLPGPKAAEQSHSARTLPATDHWRCRNAVARREGVHHVGRQERFLAREVGWRIFVPDHVQLAIWPLSLETNAIRYQRSAPEVFQRKMNQLVEDLKGIKVIVDEFVIVGYGDTHEAAVADHDRNLNAFLHRFEERGVVLNAQKLCLRETEVSFVGHVTTAKVLCVDLAKVQAIMDMPAPTNKARVQLLLGMVQYLSKFLPNLADLNLPLRDLTQKEVEWTWGPPQASAFTAVKAAVSSTPVLRYYN